MKKLILSPDEINSFVLQENKCILIENGKIVFVNDSMKFLFSTDPIGYSVKDLFQPEDFSSNSRLISLLNNPQKLHCYWLGVHMVIDRIIYPSNILVSSIKISNRWLWRIYAFFDIDDFFKRHFSSLFLDYIPDAVAFIDSESNIISANKVFLETFGYGLKEEIFKKNIDRLILPENEYAAGKEMTKNIMMGMRLGKDDVPRIRKDGSIIWVSIAGGPVYFEDDTYNKKDTEPIGIVVIYRDVTEQHVKREIYAAQEMKIQNFYKYRIKASEAYNIEESLEILAEGFYQNSFLGIFFNINSDKGKLIIRKGLFENTMFEEKVIEQLKSRYRDNFSYITEKHYHILDFTEERTKSPETITNKILFSPFLMNEDIYINEFPKNFILAVSEAEKIEYNEELFSMYSQTIHILTQQNILKENRENLLRTEVLLQTAGAVSHRITQPLTVAMLSTSQIHNICEDQAIIKHIDLTMEALKRMEDEIKKLRNITEYNTEKYIGETKIINLN
ncbi:PAS domain-containing protein [candidate division WOR-3 bacterium]|nr:PAS domain-containing protein [candidate division WOR-3 bacterium]